MNAIDRELTDFAAKAAGIDLGSAYESAWKPGTDWNPLVYDGDAFDLMIRLRICMTHDRLDSEGWGVTCGVVDDQGMLAYITETFGETRSQVARRAIVRVAARIGRKM